MSVMPIAAGKVEKRDAGRALTARTGMSYAKILLGGRYVDGRKAGKIVEGLICLHRGLPRSLERKRRRGI